MARRRNIAEIDLTNYKETTSARVAPGRYSVVVTSADQDESKAGNPMIVLNLTINGGEFDGSTLVDRLALTEKAMFRVVAFMQALGLKTPKEKFRVNLDSWVGRSLSVDVDDDTYQGRTSSRVVGYIRDTAPAAKEERDLDVEDDTDDTDTTEVDDTEVDLDNVDL